MGFEKFKIDYDFFKKHVKNTLYARMLRKNAMNAMLEENYRQIKLLEKKE